MELISCLLKISNSFGKGRVFPNSKILKLDKMTNLFRKVKNILFSAVFSIAALIGKQIKELCVALKSNNKQLDSYQMVQK